MAQSLNKIEERDKEVEEAINKLRGSIPGIQKQIFATIQKELKGLETKDGKILMTIRNLKLVNRIKATILKDILNDDYKAAVMGFVRQFDASAKTTNKYLKSLPNAGV